MITDVKKPGTPEELVHAGVKGMKWGVRKQRTPSAGQRFKTANPTGRQRDSAILKARTKLNTGQSHSYANEAVARRLTRGEKAVAGILLVSGIGTIPIAVALGVNKGLQKRAERKA